MFRRLSTPLLRTRLLTPTTTLRFHSTKPPPANAKPISVTFIVPHKPAQSKTVTGHVGDSILDVAHAHGVDLEGACESSLACSTCHIIVKDEEVFDRLPEACDEEEDLLDLAFDLRETSRLGCQVILTEDLDGIEVEVPSATRNFYVDGHVPQPH